MGRKRLGRTRLTARINKDTYKTLERMAKSRSIPMGVMIDRVTEYTHRRSRIANAQGLDDKIMVG